MEKQALDKLRTQVFGLYPFLDILYHQGKKSFHYLELRSIDSLTDEEAKELSVIDFEHHPDKDIDFFGSVDYLRSIGIALPYLGHSVEELVQLGIVKLKI